MLKCSWESTVIPGAFENVGRGGGELAGANKACYGGFENRE